MATHEEEIGLRLQEEHRALLKLCQVVKAHIASQPQVDLGTWLDGLRVAFERLHAHVERCLDMKARDGYLATILQERPTFARRVAAIQAEQGQLLRMSESIRQDLAATKADEGLVVADLCARVERFITVVGQHEQRESLIVLFAFNQDIGGQ
jgi:hypothetical protein